MNPSYDEFQPILGNAVRAVQTTVANMVEAELVRHNNPTAPEDVARINAIKTAVHGLALEKIEATKASQLKKLNHEFGFQELTASLKYNDKKHWWRPLKSMSLRDDLSDTRRELIDWHKTEEARISTEAMQAQIDLLTEGTPQYAKLQLAINETLEQEFRASLPDQRFADIAQQILEEAIQSNPDLDPAQKNGLYEVIADATLKQHREVTGKFSMDVDIIDHDAVDALGITPQANSCFPRDEFRVAEVSQAAQTPNI